MCGIVGFTGKRQAAGVLLGGLEKLEYRGYDSAGLAVQGQGGKVQVVKAEGRLGALLSKTDGGNTVEGQCGIAHTRWATHGEPSERNAHPHYSNDKAVVAVHNGIIENYLALRAELEEKGYVFYSQTDTEVAVKLIDYFFKQCGEPLVALSEFMRRARGSYAIAALFEGFPEEVFAARKDSPLLVGIADGECFLASDAPAILAYTREVYYIGNGEMARLKKGSAEFFDAAGKRIEKASIVLEWSAASAERAGFAHFMLKEIHEQPQAVADTLASFVREGKIDLSGAGLFEETLRRISSLVIVGCGSAYHVGVVAQYAIESIARVPVRVELASEFRYRVPILQENELVLVISQSGETADSLAAVREARARGAKTLAIVNVVGSSIAREAENVMYTLAGPEIAVATTKAYSTQLVAIYALGVALGRARGELGDTEYARLVAELCALPEKISATLRDTESARQVATGLSGAKDAFFIGRGVDFAACLEGSLKMKEISYMHSEAYAAGELKHGTISLVEEGMPVVGVLTQAAVLEKTLSNMSEVKSRGAKLVAITWFSEGEIEKIADFVLHIPKTDERFAASLAVVPLQLMAYYVSVARGLDVDKPRNLAKSVTVE